MAGISTLTRPELSRWLRAKKPSNEAANEGWALVAVLPRDRFALERIPHSMNVPPGEEGMLECFAREKPIVLYSVVPDDAARAADALCERGFVRVLLLRGGLRAWKAAGGDVRAAAFAAPRVA